MKYEIKGFYEKLGAVVDNALHDVMDNIYNPNTSESKKRKITVNIEVEPKEHRSRQDVTIQAKTTLAPADGVEISLLSGQDYKTGEIKLAEYGGQMFGQVGIGEVPDNVDVETGEIIEDQMPEKVIDLREKQQ